MSFKENCENGDFLQNDFNGSVNGILIGPEFYLNQLNLHQRIFLGILFFFLSIVSILGNSLALLTISNRKLQVLYKCCVVSQCLGDILMAVFVGINSVNNFIQDTVAWNFGSFMCGWIPYVTTMSALLSSMILTCIAIDRYQGVVLLSRKWNPKMWTGIFIVGCLWLAAAGTTIPTFLGYNQLPACFLDFEAKTSFYAHLCLANQTISNYYFFSVFALIFLPLLIAFTILYVAIARRMWLKKRNIKNQKVLSYASSSSTLDTNIEIQKSHQEINQNCEPRKNKSRKGQPQKNRVFTIILIIMFTFIVCRLPQWIFVVITTMPWFRLSGNFWWTVKYLLSALSLANTTLNPFIYSFLNEAMNLKGNFKTGLKNLQNIKLKNIRINFFSSNIT